MCLFVGLLDNYISVFESPLVPRQHSILCTSLSYLGGNPSPPFNPTLAFFHPNVLVLHTGSGLRFISLSLLLREVVTVDANSTEDLSCAPLALSSEPLCKLPTAAGLQCAAAWLHEDSALSEMEPSEVEEQTKASTSLFSSLAVRASLDLPPTVLT